MQSALATERLPFVAENLGVITPEVEALRERFGFPGMAILQFAFGTDPQAPDFKPHNYPRNRVVYTGTHDNDTTVGWWTGDVGHSTRSNAEIAIEREYARRYLGTRRPRRCTGTSSARCWRRSPTPRSFRRRTCWAWEQRSAHESAGHAQRQLAHGACSRTAHHDVARRLARDDRDLRTGLRSSGYVWASESAIAEARDGERNKSPCPSP